MCVDVCAYKFLQVYTCIYTHTCCFSYSILSFPSYAQVTNTIFLGVQTAAMADSFVNGIPVIFVVLQAPVSTPSYCYCYCDYYWYDNYTHIHIHICIYTYICMHIDSYLLYKYIYIYIHMSFGSVIWGVGVVMVQELKGSGFQGSKVLEAESLGLMPVESQRAAFSGCLAQGFRDLVHLARTKVWGSSEARHGTMLLM